MAGSRRKLRFMKRTYRVAGICLGLLLLLCICGAAYLFSPAFETRLTRGLEEEKSYFEHAGTSFQLRPELRSQKGNLETWDKAEAIASVIEKQNLNGRWASWSDQLSGLPDPLRLDSNRNPMCVIEIGQALYVVRGVKKQVARCDAVAPGFSVNGVRSGELAPSSDRLAEIYYQRFAQ
jgi:hypothetical protein